MNAHHPQTLVAPPSRTASSTTPRRWLGSAAAVASGATAALGAVWLARPGWNPHETEIASPLGLATSAEVAALVQLVVGLIGLGASIAALVVTSGRRSLWPGWLGPVGSLLGAVTGLTLLGTGVIMGLGYITAVLVPVGLVVLVAGLIRLGGRARWGTLAALTGAAGVGVVSGVLTPDALGLTSMLGSLVTEAPTRLAAPFTLTATALVWAVLGLQASTANGHLERAGSWVLRHRTSITVVAALGPLPYALQRLTWLTPWPVLYPEDITPEIRLWGMMMSFGAWAGFVLTLGLIQRWARCSPAGCRASPGGRCPSGSQRSRGLSWPRP
ncbi:hypothetical protein [Ornithinicoccus hortensis]|uniref:Uncharacterized protein n=1 Tax=Ornithinicoccus hortensis TaxID=82346 RepID=A0A542YNG2_9MICO|nr:hypothetical protein [Ornithinicoccus hortensis]TQL49474.1 hypothetical protein FB467_0547 [Ornithinicoccus hortensis]